MGSSNSQNMASRSLLTTCQVELDVELHVVSRTGHLATSTMGHGLTLETVHLLRNSQTQ